MMASGANEAFAQAVAVCPLVAILRGIKPEEAVATGAALVEAGFTLIEIPLNSPDPFDSISRLSAALGEAALIGAGTVLDRAGAEAAVDAGARLLLAPNLATEMIEVACRREVVAMPGVATASEAISALAAGAGSLKLFPAKQLASGTISAWQAILPRKVPIFAVGGVGNQDFAEFFSAGAAGFGLGSSLYKPGADVATVARNARSAIEALRACKARA